MTRYVNIILFRVDSPEWINMNPDPESVERTEPMTSQ